MRERARVTRKARGAVLAAVLAGLALAAAPAEAKRLHLPAPDRAVRWLAPVAGASLPSGGSVRVAWEPGPAFARLGDVHEWELFLSLDGGRTWSVRLTPHLALERRDLAVELPDLPVPSARLLLRIGDEHVEHEVELGSELPLVRAAAPPARIDFARRAPAAGERARAGTPGVRRWRTGTAEGRDLAWRSAAAPTQVLDAGWRATLGGLPPALVPESPRPAAAETSSIRPAPLAAAGMRRASSAARPPTPPIDPLLATSRRNT